MKSKKSNFTAEELKQSACLAFLREAGVEPRRPRPANSFTINELSAQMGLSYSQTAKIAKDKVRSRLWRVDYVSENNTRTAVYSKA
jgi:hypothetical protein